MILKFIIGSAGTGKTTTLIKSVNACNGSCVCIAYTHSAVNNIRDKIKSTTMIKRPDKIETIHKYFQIDFEGNIHKTKNFTKFIFIDEFSLIPLKLFNSICHILKKADVIVICVGDILQLGPVETENKLIDYMQLKKSLNGEVYDYILKRFTCESVNDYLDLFYHLSTTLFMSKYFKSADKLILNKCYRYDDEILKLTTTPLNQLNVLEFDKVIMYVDNLVKTKASFVVLASKYKYLKKIGNMINKHSYPVKCGSVDFGDDVILQTTLNKNFYNGDIVKYVDIDTVEQVNEVARVEQVNEVVKPKITVQGLNQLVMPVWLSSIHKAQGREWDYVIIVINDMFTYGMMYTAITRAKRKVIFAKM
jgi:superfamily I DNA/RNA helicase